MLLRFIYFFGIFVPIQGKRASLILSSPYKTRYWAIFTFLLTLKLTPMGVTTGAASKYCCLTVQNMLDNISGPNTPRSIRQETNGFMMSLMSDENTSGFEAVQTRSRAGKALPGVGNRTVEIKYQARECATIVDTCPSLCDPAAVAADDNLYSTVSVDGVKATSFRLSKEEFRQLCEEPSDRQARRIADRVAALKKAVNEDLISKFIAGLGNYYTAPGGTPVDSSLNPITLNLFDSAARPNAMGLFPLIKHFKQSGFTGRPIVVGGTSFLAWMEARGVFAGNVDGLDIGRAVGDINLALDYEIDGVFGDSLEHVLTYFPGAIQLLEWYQFEPGTIYEELKEDYQETTLTMDGFTFDFAVRYNECDRCWDFHLCKHYDLFKIPDDAWSAECNQLSNGCLQYLVDCGDLTCDTIKC